MELSDEEVFGPGVQKQQEMTDEQAFVRASRPKMDYGSPGSVRLAVGTARPRDRLATIQQFYPDAKPYGPDNFVYTDPQTGRQTLYNPPGLDLGDVPSITREAVETLGGAAGATIGAPLGMGGMLAGGTLGATAGGQMVDLGRRLAGLPQQADNGQIARDAAVDLLSNATGEMTGLGMAAAPNAVRRMIANPEAPRIADAAASIGVTPTVGMVAQGPVGSTESLAARVLPASRAAREQARFAGEIESAAINAVPGAQMAPGEAAAQAGAALKQGASAGYARFRATRQRLDDAVYNSFPSGASVPVAELGNVAARIRTRIAEAPETFGPQLQPVLDRIEGVLNDAARYNGRLPVKTQRNIRTLIGQELETEATTKLTPEAQTLFRDAYRAMTTDLRNAAAAQSPAALRNLNRHDRLVRAFRSEDLGRESIADSLDKILKAGSDEAAYSALRADSGGLNRMRNVLNRLDEPQRRIVARATWDRMLTTPQGNMNLNYLLGQWNKMNPAARRELFGPVTDLRALADLMTVLGGMREADRSRNFSNTAYTLIQASLGDRAITETMTKIGALATGGAAAGSMFPTETITTAASAYLLSEAMHNPGVARALVQAARGTAPEITETVQRSIARAVGRIGSEDLMAEPDQRPKVTNSVNANATRNGMPALGSRAMSTTP